METKKGIRKLLSYWFEGDENQKLTILMFILLSVMLMIDILLMLDAYLHSD